MFETILDSGGLSTGLSKLVGATTAAIGAGVAAAGTLVTTAVSAYADYEQLVGGVDTLFKESSQKVQDYANVAYESAGLSANAYMETVTSFSASLLQSLDGDTNAAADKANQAIIDMSDNANKMGSSMESIQNAYQGFAKQNYTMLDNLKLGYGGTKEEMARLLEDAGKIAGIEYDISSYADVVDAIHVMQESMDIAGTTAKEASSTISGSVNAAKSAWSNLLVGIADDNQDFGKLIDNFVESAATVAENLLPRIEIAINGVGELIEKLLPVVVAKIPDVINKVLPSLLESGSNIIRTILEGIQTNLPTIISGALVIINQFITSFFEFLPMIVDIGLQILLQLALGIVQYLPELIPTIVEVVLQIVDTLLDNLDLLIDASIEIIMALTEGIIEALPTLLKKAPEIVIKLCDAIIKNTPKLLDASYKIIITLAEALIKYLPKLLAKAPEMITKLLETYIKVVSSMAAVGEKIVEYIVKALDKAWNGISSAVTDWIGKLKGWFENGIASIKDVGTHMVEGVWQGISDGYAWICGKITGWVNNVLKWIKDRLGIKSPSTVMRDEIGKYMAQGVAVGFEENDPMKEVEDTINHSWAGLQSNLTADVSMRSSNSINYDSLGYAVANALAKSGLTVKVNDREFGRVVRSVI